MEVGGNAGAAKSGHGGYRVGMTAQVDSGDVEVLRRVEVGDARPGVELFSSSRSEVGATGSATLYFKGIILLAVICRFAVQPDSQLHLTVGVKLS